MTWVHFLVYGCKAPSKAEAEHGMFRKTSLEIFAGLKAFELNWPTYTLPSHTGVIILMPQVGLPSAVLH